MWAHYFSPWITLIINFTRLLCMIGRSRTAGTAAVTSPKSTVDLCSSLDLSPSSHDGDVFFSSRQKEARSSSIKHAWAETQLSIDIPKKTKPSDSTSMLSPLFAGTNSPFSNQHVKSVATYSIGECSPLFSHTFGLQCNAQKDKEDEEDGEVELGSPMEFPSSFRQVLIDRERDMFQYRGRW